MPAASLSDPWLPYRRPRHGARARLFCFPYAGGGASVYRDWYDDLPAGVEVCAVQLPGRESRLAEAPVASIARLVPMLADGLDPRLAQPFAFFGHSMGAIIAFELARELRRRHLPGPSHLFVSACPAPHIPDTDGTHALPESALIERLRALGGMSDEALANRELMELILPVFRADAAITETYAHVAEAPLRAPITAFAGLADEKAKQADVDAWRRHTCGAFSLTMVPGSHFFLRGEGRGTVLGAIAKAFG